MEIDGWIERERERERESNIKIEIEIEMKSGVEKGERSYGSEQVQARSVAGWLACCLSAGQAATSIMFGSSGSGSGSGDSPGRLGRLGNCTGIITIVIIIIIIISIIIIIIPARRPRTQLK